MGRQIPGGPKLIHAGTQVPPTVNLQRTILPMPDAESEMVKQGREVNLAVTGKRLWILSGSTDGRSSPNRAR